MPYEFKKLSDVAVIDTVTDNTNVLVEENGVVKKINQNEISGMKEVSWNDLKDKPFDQQEPMLVELFPSTDIVFHTHDYPDMALDAQLELNTLLVPNQVYLVIWDEVEYRLVTYTDTYSAIMGNPYIPRSEGPDNGLPFYISCEYVCYCQIPYSTEDETHNISIYEIRNNPKQISGQFVEDMYYTDPDIVKYLIEKSNLSFALMGDVPNYDHVETYSHYAENVMYIDHMSITGPAFWSAIGKEFLVNWDDVHYKCVSEHVDDQLVFGNPELYKPSSSEANNCPFCIVMDRDSTQGVYIIANDNALSHTVEISYIIPGNVHQMPAKYISEHTHKLGEMYGSISDQQLPSRIPLRNLDTTSAASENLLGAFGIGHVIVNKSGIQPLGLRSYNSKVNYVTGGMIAVTFTLDYSVPSNAPIEIAFYQSSSTRDKIQDTSGAYVTKITAGTHLFVKTASDWIMLL